MTNPVYGEGLQDGSDRAVPARVSAGRSPLRGIRSRATSIAVPQLALVNVRRARR